MEVWNTKTESEYQAAIKKKEKCNTWMIMRCTILDKERSGKERFTILLLVYKKKFACRSNSWVNKIVLDTCCADFFVWPTVVVLRILTQFFTVWFSFLPSSWKFVAISVNTPTNTIMLIALPLLVIPVWLAWWKETTRCFEVRTWRWQGLDMLPEAIWDWS